MVWDMIYPDRSLVVATVIGILVGSFVSWVLQWPLHRNPQPTTIDMTQEQARGRLSALTATITVAQEELRKAEDPAFIIPSDQINIAKALFEGARTGESEARIFFDQGQFRKSFERATTAIVDAQRAFITVFTWEPTTTP